MINIDTLEVVAIHGLCYPFYQFLGTLRHELSHWLAARLSGVGVLAIHLMPHMHDGRFYWGRIEYNRATAANQNQHIHLAPYYVDFASIALYVTLLAGGTLARIKNEHLAIATAILLILSPIVDVVYNYLKYRLCGIGDFAAAAALRK